MPFSASEFYSRQILFSGIGQEGQEKLRTARVVIVGCGGTGSAIASLLTRSGVGFLRIIDRDYVEASNLQRQTLYDEEDAAAFLPKAVASARKLAQANSAVEIEPQVADLTPANVETLLDGCSLIMDGTDNFETRYLINDYAVMKGKPWIYSAAVGSVGVTMNILPGETACFACIFPNPPSGVVETCETAGILNVAVNSIGALAAAEALKFLVGARALMRRTLLSEDLWWSDRAEIPAQSARADCSCCVKREFPYLQGQNLPPHYTLRKELSPDSRAAQNDRSESIGKAAGTAGRGPQQRLRAPVLARTIRDDLLPRRPGDHQGDDRCWNRAEPLRQIRRRVG